MYFPSWVVSINFKIFPKCNIKFAFCNLYVGPYKVVCTTFFFDIVVESLYLLYYTEAADSFEFAASLSK